MRTILIITTLWKRREIEDLVLSQVRTLINNKYFKIKVLCIGSEGEQSKELADRYGFIYNEQSNEFLGLKWNKGLYTMKDESWDYLMVIGSDDLVSENILKAYYQAVIDGATIVGVEDFYAHDIKTNQMGYWKEYTTERKGEPIGAGMLFARELIHNCNYQPWAWELNRGLDRTVVESIRRNNPKEKTKITLIRGRENKFVIIDLKGGTSIYPYKKLTLTPALPELIYPTYFSNEVYAKVCQMVSYKEPELTIGSMATIPSRNKILKKVVMSILPQVDLLNIFMDGHSHIPSYLAKNYKVVIHQSKDYKQKLGDAGKFIGHTANGFNVLFDDDIIYPSGYVDYLKSKIEETGRAFPVSLHGRNFIYPITSYYKDGMDIHRCLYKETQNRIMDIIGTGVLAYHSDTIQVNIDDFKKENMADIWFSKIAHEKKIPLLALKHDAGYLEYLKREIERETTIAHNSHNNDEYQTKVVNDMPIYRPVWNFVYPYWHAGAKENEIIYSIRSIYKYFRGYYKIWIVGDLHPLLDSNKIGYIPCPQKSGDISRALEITNKLQAVINCQDIPKHFIYMYDDIVFNNYFTIGQLLDVRKDGKLEALKPNNKIYQGLVEDTINTLRLHGRTTYNYETHLPRLLSKERLEWIIYHYHLDRCERLFNSIYCNEYISGLRALEVNQDPTITYLRNGNTTQLNAIIDGKIVINYNDRAFTDELIEYFNKTLPESIYEHTKTINEMGKELRIKVIKNHHSDVTRRMQRKGDYYQCDNRTAKGLIEKGLVVIEKEEKAIPETKQHKIILTTK